MTRTLSWLVMAGLVGGFLVVRVTTDDPELGRWFVIAATALGMIGAWMAAFAFASGDYLRRAWFLNGLGYAALLVSAVVRRPGAPEWVQWTRVAMTVVSNVTGVLGTFYLSRTMRAAGLTLPLGPLPRAITWGLVVVLTGLAAGIPLWVNLRELTTNPGTYGAWVGAFSSAGDCLMLILIAPLLMTAIALRGGTLASVFALLSASYMCWLGFDAQDTVDFFFNQGPSFDVDLLRAAVEPFRLAACAFMFAAGLAQRRLIREEEPP